jgi:hypothetical protein
MPHSSVMAWRLSPASGATQDHSNKNVVVYNGKKVAPARATYHDPEKYLGIYLKT